MAVSRLFRIGVEECDRRWFLLTRSRDQVANSASFASPLARARYVWIPFARNQIEGWLAVRPPSLLRSYGGQPARGLPTVAHAVFDKRERRLVDQTGIEPVTS